MASEQFRGPEKVRFPALLLLAVLAFVIVAIVAATQDTEWAVPVVILLGVVVAVALTFRLVSGAKRGEGEVDNTDPIPRQPPEASRPLGDTTEAHDEISPHDLPKDSLARPAVEAEAEGSEGTTSGPVEPGEPEHGARTDLDR